MSEATTNEIIVEHDFATVILARWVWDVVVSVLRQKDEYGHISATADALEWQLKHGPTELNRLVDAVLDSLASGVLTADLDEASDPFVKQRELLVP